MLEVVSLVLSGGEVKRLKNAVPQTVEVDVNIDKVSKKAPDMAILDFTYSIDYKPQVAILKMYGSAYCRDTPANIKKLLEAFKKKKTVPMELGASVINMINANAGMNSIFLIRPFNLLPPFMPPLIATEQTVTPRRTTKPRK